MLSAASSLTTGKGHESHENSKVTKKNFSWLGHFQQRLAGNHLARLKHPEYTMFFFVSFVFFVAFVVSAGR